MLSHLFRFFFILVLGLSCPVFSQPPNSKNELANPSELLENYFETIPSAWKGHRDFAEWLVDEMQPAEIVDLGVDYGYSTFVFANAAFQNGFGTVTGIDFFEGDGFTGHRNTYQQVLKWTHEFGLTNLDIIKGDFLKVSKDWVKPIDILHIDGFHTYKAVSSDYNAWAKFVQEEGIILFHDVNVNNPAFEVVHFFRELEDGYKLYFLQSYGLGIITKNLALFEKIKKSFPNVYDYDETPL